MKTESVVSFLHSFCGLSVYEFFAHSVLLAPLEKGGDVGAAILFLGAVPFSQKLKTNITVILAIIYRSVL